MEKCPYCKGSGFIGTTFKEVVESGHRVMYPYTEPCFCQINFCIGKKYGVLSTIGDAHPADSKTIHETYGDHDYIFYGTEDVFLYIVKCYFLKGFMSKNYIILEGGTIVEQYNVPRDSTGDWLTTSHLNQYDMLALLFTTTARYSSLKDCVAEVIKNRNRLAKPTWIYTRSKDDWTKTREYSQDLDYYKGLYREIDLNTVPKLRGYSPRKLMKREIENDLNNKIGGI